MSSEPDWPPGTKVVCINDDENLYSTIGIWGADLKRGQIYTIKALFYDAVYCVNVVTLVEITRPIQPLFGYEPGFGAARFERLPERKTDIGIFERMLTGAQNNVKENA